MFGRGGMHPDPHQRVGGQEIVRLRSLLVAVVCAAVACLGCAAQNSSVPLGKEITLEKTTFSFDQRKAPFEIFEYYIIKPGDMLDLLLRFDTMVERPNFKIGIDHTVAVRFVQPPQLSQAQKPQDLDQVQRVRPDGSISLPYLGSVRVLGKTVDELTAELNKAYLKYLRYPNVYVTIPDFEYLIREIKTDLKTAPRGLSRLATVRPDGYITFPAAGEMLVAGKTLPQVSKELNQRYAEIMLGMQCDLFLEQHSGSIIYVVGEVKTPGSYRIANPVSAMQGVALAGGYTSNALLEGVMVVRKHGDKLVATRVDLSKNIDLSSGSAYFFLMPDDIVVVPKTRLATAAEVARQVGDITFYRGWGGLNFGVDATPPVLK
jgi:polysaccharide export outer membrane protein